MQAVRRGGQGALDQVNLGEGARGEGISQCPSMANRAWTWWEFFAGGGMARLGLGETWRCAFANDLSKLKCAHYQRVFGAGSIHCGDVWKLKAADLPGRADLAWASFPCQDVSLAGGRNGGLNGKRSSAFHGFWDLISASAREGRAPHMVVLENVPGLLTARGGADFLVIAHALARAGYRFGALEIDAALFSPQSRSRVFIVATRDPVAPAGRPGGPFHSQGVRAAHDRLSEALKRQWIWWRAEAPPARNAALADILEPDEACAWRSAAETQALIAMMGPAHRARLNEALHAGERRVGAAFKRIRTENGVRVQRAEIRFDGLAGCLRTPAGGSSRQIVVVTENGQTRSRLLSPREAARLMGAPDEYPLPDSANAALQLFGDGVSVPVVAWLNAQVLTPHMQSLTDGRSYAA